MHKTIHLHQSDRQAESLRNLRESLGDCVPGHALPRAFYKDPAIFEADMRHFVMAHWHCVGHTSMLAQTGSYFTAEFAGESIIIVRNGEGQVRALLNVCRHRGSRICTESHGQAPSGKLVCPYHAWTYDCDGRLLHARATNPDLKKDALNLRRVHVHVEEGMIFISLADQPLGLDHVRDAFAASARIYGWNNAKVIARKTYLMQANWKLVEENYQECYHCGPAHQEYSKRHTYARPQAQRDGPDDEMRARDLALGIGLQDKDFYFSNAHPGQESADSIRSAMVAPMVTGSRTGAPVAPLMGAFKGKDYDGGFSFIDVGPTSNFVAYPDYALVYRTIPVSVDQTAFELLWLVDRDAVENVDYKTEEVIWLWDHTSQEDKRIIEVNQQGINSRFFTPGPYAPMEIYAQRYSEWYLQAMRSAVGA